MPGQKPESKRARQAREAALHRDMAEATAAMKAAAKAERDAGALALAADAALEGTITRDDLATARMVRDKYGWHPVVKLHRATVEVGTGYSWTERVRIDRVREWR